MNNLITDTLNEELIRSSLSYCLKELNIFVFDEIDSTNNEAKRRISSKGLTSGLFIADKQTAGRGRSGHSFYSPESTGIYLSYVFTPSEGIQAATHATTKAAVCVCRAIEELYGVEASIKWVNDIYVNDKKVCGILSEAITNGGLNRGSVVVGIGVNICTADFPDDIMSTAGAISRDKQVSRNLLAATIVNYLYDETEYINDVSYIKNYRQHSMLTGKDITYYEKEELKSATVIDIDDEAGLVVKLPDGTVTILRNGEVFTIRKA